MDPLAALLSWLGLGLGTELRSRNPLLEDAARACGAELESRTARLDALPEEIQQIVFGQLCKALDPRSAVAYSSASKGLRELMQRVGEGAGKSPLQQLKEENAAAAALGRKLRLQSCKALREAKDIWWFNKGLSAADLATLGKLTPVLPALEELELTERSASAGPDGGQRPWWADEGIFILERDCLKMRFQNGRSPRARGWGCTFLWAAWCAMMDYTLLCIISIYDLALFSARNLRMAHRHISPTTSDDYPLRPS